MVPYFLILYLFQVFQGPRFSEFRFFRVQVFQGPGPGSRVRVQVLEVAVKQYFKKNTEAATESAEAVTGDVL